MAQQQRPVTKTPTSPYGNSPKSLAPTAAPDDFEAELAQATAAAKAAPAAAQPGDSFDAELAQAGGQQPTAPAPVLPSPQAGYDAEGNPIVEADPSFAQANFTPQGIGRQLSDAYQRFRGAFTGSDREQLNDLKRQGVFADVKQDESGNVLVRRNGAKKFEKFDKKTVELLGDVIDGSRMAFETGAQAVSGAAAGLAATPETLGLGTIPAAVAGGAAGSLAAQQAGDVFAEKALGIERDPTRSRVKEAAMTAGLGGLFGGLGGVIAKRAANSLAKREAFAVTSNFVKQKADDAAAAIAEVQSSGIRLDKNGKFFLDPAQTGGQVIPELQQTAKDLSTDPRFRKFRLEQGQTLVDAFDSVRQKIGNTTGESVGRSGNFALDAKAIRDFEGKTIGKFRQTAADTAKGATQGTPELSSFMDETFQKMGNGRYTRKVPSTNDAEQYAVAVENAFPDLEPSYAKKYARVLTEIQADLNRKGGMPLELMEHHYKRLTDSINAFEKSDSGRPLSRRLIELKNSLRNDYTTAIGANTPPGSQAAYTTALKQYSETMGAVDTLKTALKNDNVSTDALAHHIFGSGLAKEDQVRSVKALYEHSDPQGWKDVTGAYMNSLRNKYVKGNGVTEEVNWGGVKNELQKLPSGVRSILYEGTGVTQKTIDALTMLGEEVQSAKVGFEPSPKQKGLLKRAFGTIASTWRGDFGQAESMVNSLGKDRAVGIWLKEGGAQEILKAFPDAASKRKFSKFIELYDPNSGTGRVMAPVAKTGARQSTASLLQGLTTKESDQNMTTEQP